MEAAALATKSAESPGGLCSSPYLLSATLYLHFTLSSLSKKSVMDPTDDVLQLLLREELTLFWASRVQWLHRDCTQLAPDSVAGPRRA